MPTPLVRIALVTALAFVAIGDNARAQSAARTPDSLRTAVAFNPFGIPFGYAQGELERAVGGGVSLGVGGSFFDFDDDEFSSAEVKARYYPSERGLRGFSVGLSAGYARIEDRGTQFIFPDRTESITQVIDGPSLGVSIDYNWLLGARRRFLVGVGFGGKRIFTDDRNENGDFINLSDIRAYPTGRFVIGLAF